MIVKQVVNIQNVQKNVMKNVIDNNAINYVKKNQIVDVNVQDYVEKYVLKYAKIHYINQNNKNYQIRMDHTINQSVKINA